MQDKEETACGGKGETGLMLRSHFIGRTWHALVSLEDSRKGVHNSRRSNFTGLFCCRLQQNRCVVKPTECIGMKRHAKWNIHRIQTISRRPNFTKFEHNTFGEAMKTFRTEFWKYYRKGLFLQKTPKKFSSASSRILYRGHSKQYSHLVHFWCRVLD